MTTTSVSESLDVRGPVPAPRPAGRLPPSTKSAAAYFERPASPDGPVGPKGLDGSAGNAALTAMTMRTDRLREVAARGLFPPERLDDRVRGRVALSLHADLGRIAGRLDPGPPYLVGIPDGGAPREQSLGCCTLCWFVRDVGCFCRALHGLHSLSGVHAGPPIPVPAWHFRACALFPEVSANRRATAFNAPRCQGSRPRPSAAGSRDRTTTSCS
jgi:hypothetical protein